MSTEEDVRTRNEWGKGLSETLETQKVVNAVAEASADNQEKSAGEPPKGTKDERR